jgi:BirA family transcriptional regulator, biotin operon repressor / biotin---[acetyl-CoA-carboxylase] ligase
VSDEREAGAGGARTLGLPRLHLRRTGSTNDRARALALAGVPHGALVSAGEQTAGRGRQGRRWSAPAGSALLFSLVLRSPPPLLPLAAAVAICDVAGESAAIKWPNDVVVRREGALRKLAGILIEGRPQQRWAVLGIGLNVAVELDQLPPEVRASAATLGLTAAEIEPTLTELLAALERRLDERQEATLQAWRARDVLRGREVTWSSGRGRAEGIDGEGRLVVALRVGGHATLRAGEVHLLDVG